MFGPLNIPLSSYVFCFLHAKLRLTETILRHQIKGYYSESKTPSQAQKKFETVLKKLTKNNNIKVNIPKKEDDQRRFGDVPGFTGGMVKGVLNGWEELGQLAVVTKLKVRKKY